MATSDSNALERWYENSIGSPSTADEVYGYWLFALGIMAAFVGIMFVVLSSSPGQPIRGLGIGLAALGLVVLLVGQIIRLPLKRAATTLSIGGAAIAALAVAWFGVAFNAGNWGASFAHNEPVIIGLYGLGIFVMGAGSVLTPRLTERGEEQAAAEARAGEAEAKRDAAMDEISRQAEQDIQNLAEAREEQAAAEARAGEAEAERDAAIAEIDRRDEEDAEKTAAGVASQVDDRSDDAPDSQSQFELYTDEGGQYRWRLRHNNGNIIADGSEGYASRQKAMQGLHAVKRDAIDATVQDLDAMDEDEDTDDEVLMRDDDRSDDATDSQSQFELYTDDGGQYRWRLRHNNGNIIADGSEGYASRQKAMQGLHAVKRDVGEATVQDLDAMDEDAETDEGVLVGDGEH